MKAQIRTTLVLIIALAAISCDRNISIGIGEEITIPFDKTASMYDFGYETTISFTKLIEESRCPPGKVCFWEGRALVEIMVNNTVSFELEIGASGDDVPLNNSVEWGNYNIELKSVIYDSDDDYGVEKKYSIIIEVNRL